MGLIKRADLEEKGVLLIEKVKAAPSVPALTKSQKTIGQAAISPNQLDLPRAKSEAQVIIDNAQQEAEAIREEAREAGRQEGKEEAAVNIEESLGTLNQAVKERKKIIADSENEILKLSLKIAEQVIRSEVSLHRDVCLNIVSEAINRVSDREQIIVRVNRDDAEYIKRYKDRLAGILDGVKSFSIIEDSNVEAGGCVIETNLGFIDARINTKLKSIEEALQRVTSEND